MASVSPTTTSTIKPPPPLELPDDGLPEGIRIHPIALNQPERWVQGKALGVKRGFSAVSSAEDGTIGVIEKLSSKVSREEAHPLLEEVSGLSFKHRKESGLALYRKEALFSLCEFAYEMGLQEEREFKTALNTILGVITGEQKKALDRSLREDAIAKGVAYAPLREVYSRRFYQEISGHQKKFQFPSTREVLGHVIQKAEEATQTGDSENPIEGKVYEFAMKQLQLLDEGEAISTDWLFHMTPEAENVLHILQQGIQVKDQSKYEGAFVSTQPELVFGDYGVLVTPCGLLEKGTPCHIERRPIEDGDGVWIGLLKNLTPSKRVVIVSSNVTPKSRSHLQSILMENDFSVEVIEAAVMSLFCKFAREKIYAIPVSERMCSTKKLRSWNRGSEE